MKKFRFRLERVLQFRESIKSERQRDLLLANQELARREARRNDIEGAIRSCELMGQGEMIGAEIELRGAYLARLLDELEQAGKAIEEARAKVEEARTAYIEAAKDAEALVMLKRKRRQEYDDELLKEQEKLVDEMTVQKGNTLYEADETSLPQGPES